MNFISVSDKTGDLTVSVQKGLTDEGKEQVSLSIMRKAKVSCGFISQEVICCDVGEWMALVTVVGNLREFLAAQEVKP